MQVTELQLESFRNYRQQRLALGPGLHVFEGRNAQGKTALLEAIYLAATARSFRTSRDADLVEWNQPRACIQLAMQRDSGRARNLRIEWSPRDGALKREIWLQDQPVRKLGEFLRELPLTLFTPDDLQLVQGGPQERRGYLDLLLCKLYPTYLETLGRYHKVVRNRLALLKTARPQASDELQSWDELLAEFGSSLTRYREELCRELTPLVRRLYADLSGETADLQLLYEPTGTGERDSFLARLQRKQSEEFRLRSCLVGPHRDDVALLLRSAPVRRFGSQGQQRTLALALRLSQAEILQQVGKERPVVLLDDCFSELDPGRQARLLEWLQAAPQVLITTATPLRLTTPHRHYRVEAGEVTPC
jgi:DNA replication and repair protein RecF